MSHELEMQTQPIAQHGASASELHSNPLQSEVLAPTPKGRRVAAVFGAGVLSVVATALALGYERPAPTEAPSNKDVSVSGDNINIVQGAPQWKLMKLAVANASEQQWTDPVAANIKVDEAKAARVGAPLSGRVVRVFVELGAPVKAGQSLFSVASPDLAELTDAEAQARVDWETAKTQHDRTLALIDARAIPAKDGIVSQSELKRAEIRHNLSVSKLRALKVGSSSDNEFVVNAPRAGTVVAKNLLPGQEVGAGVDANLVTIADLSTVWAVADVFESNATGIHAGTPVRVTLASEPDLLLEGKVDVVSEVVDPERHTVPVRVKFDNAERRLRPNTFARMQFLSSPTPSAVEISATALVTDGEQQSVFVQDGPGIFSRRNVVAGPVRKGRIVIFQGLKAGETVVESGAILLDNQVALSR